MNKKSTKKWALLLVLPIPLIIFAVLLQAFVLFSSPDSDPTLIGGVLSLVSVLAGIAGFVLLLGFPIWLTKFIRSKKHKNQSQSHSTHNQ